VNRLKKKKKKQSTKDTFSRDSELQLLLHELINLETKKKKNTALLISKTRWHTSKRLAIPRQVPFSLDPHDLMKPVQEVCKQIAQHPLFQPFLMHVLLRQQLQQGKGQQQQPLQQPVFHKGQEFIGQILWKKKIKKE
jgi:hypothetical protein